MAGIYIHIPFCKSRCVYCDFFSTTTLEKRDRYVDAVCEELRIRKDYLPGNKDIRTIYFGGGTPSLLTAEQLGRILGQIHKIYNVLPDAEITLEGNPDDLTLEYLQGLRLLGFNRLSMGIQTFDDTRLRFLCRRHSAAEALAAVTNAHKAGFDNISIDLMFGFPNESINEWEDDIEQAITLRPQHISAYSLMYEEGTRLTRMLEEHKIEEVNEEVSLQMYATLIERLSVAGYEQYEISNFCQPGHHSRHNSSYWDGTPYIGIGAAAHSYNGQSRQWNPSKLDVYIYSIENVEPNFEIENLTREQIYDERIMTGLRTRKGVSLNRVEEDFGTKMLEYCMHNAQPHINANKLQITTDSDGCRWLSLTNSGLFVSDDIMSDLMMIDNEQTA